MWENFSKFLLKKLGRIGAIHYDTGGNELKEKMRDSAWDLNVYKGGERRKRGD